MKLRLLFAALLSFSTIYSYAGKVTINATVTGSTAKFEPNDVTVKMGDTVVFQWLSDTHTTTSVSGGIPATVPWDAPLTSAQQTFVYVPTVIGVYNYLCTPHASMGMTGKFTVQYPVSVPKVVANPANFVMWPNPANSATHIRFGQYQEAVTISVTDITGTTVITNNYVNVVDADIDLSHLPQGRYLLYATDGSNMHTEQLVVE